MSLQACCLGSPQLESNIHGNILNRQSLMLLFQWKPSHVQNQTFLFMFGIFLGRGGQLPSSKLFEELFFLSLEIFPEGGGLPDS